MLRKPLFAILIVFLSAATGNAQVPQLINYQGVLVDEDGGPISGMLSVQFGIYGSETGGEALWSETQNVVVTDGVFHVLLGAVTSIPHPVFDGGDRYLGVKVGADASGGQSITMGVSATASGYRSIAMGTVTTASGDYSTAMGSPVGISGPGSFIIGDNSATTALSKVSSNRFYARFANGYYLYTNSTATVGAYLGPNQTSWATISDSTKKENFKPIDGESILEKISRFKLGTWNFIGQDPQQYRHYGPMAQDFFAAFGHDGIGTVGNDTTLSSADFDGVNLIAMQALERRTSQLQKENEQLRDKISELENLITTLADERMTYAACPDSGMPDCRLRTPHAEAEPIGDR